MKTYITSEEFRTKEIKNLKKLRLISILFLAFVNASIIGFFLYLFYDAYRDKNVSESFISYVSPTIFYLEFILIVPLGSVSLLIYNRFNLFIKELEDLDDDYLLLYQQFTNFSYRLFAHIPLYLISQKGLILVKNFKKIIIPAQSISVIKIYHSRIGGGGQSKCIVSIYHGNKNVDSITYYDAYPRSVDFLKENIDALDINIRIQENS
ncbi:hypothetical protein [Soonwooa sp.]|uniref:hypothetical protein n=1 Tax=Soonwooa sp. TaxID=1938592 RepID=UPI002621D8EA|nr:hypothetical protein [Soonwooa sp.]